VPALKSLDIQNRVLFVGTLSRSLFPGARLGYLVAPAEVIQEARRLRSLLLRHPPEHLQRAVAYFVTLGHYEAGIKRMRNKYRVSHDTALSALDEHRLMISGDGSRAGTAFWIDGQEGFDANRLARELETAGVLIEPGARFFADPLRACQYFRMAYTSVQPDRIAEGIGRIAMVMKKMTGEGTKPIKSALRTSLLNAPQRLQLANRPSYSSIS
jgi:GntR family transcriptional regulator/MocR family aminotransferase